ncbi:MAG: four helix bundle protein [Rhodopirellula sp.]|nr:four helix bundle protein [Rhodopirellula sp.]
MDRTNFETLRVYQLAEALEDRIWEIVMTWPVFARETVGRQLVRSADSIGANIAEGSGRGSLKDNRRFVHIARGSLYETKHWLRRAYQRKLLTPEQTDSLKETMHALTLTLNGYLRSQGRSKPESNHQNLRSKI